MYTARYCWSSLFLYYSTRTSLESQSETRQRAFTRSHNQGTRGVFTFSLSLFYTFKKYSGSVSGKKKKMSEVGPRICTARRNTWSIPAQTSTGCERITRGSRTPKAISGTHDLRHHSSSAEYERDQHPYVSGSCEHFPRFLVFNFRVLDKTSQGDSWTEYPVRNREKRAETLLAHSPTRIPLRTSTYPTDLLYAYANCGRY